MSTATTSQQRYGASPGRDDIRPQLRPARLVLSLFVIAAGVYVAAAILPGFDVGSFWKALPAALLIAALNAVLAPLVGALRLPYTVAASFLLLLVLNAALLLIVDAVTASAVEVDGFGSALIAALVISAVMTALEVVMGTNDDDVYTIRVIQRIARRSGERTETDEPGILFLEIDGLAKPVLQRAMRDGNAPTMARWLAEGRTASSSGSPTSRHRQERARPGSCLGRTRTSRPFAGSRRSGAS